MKTTPEQRERLRQATQMAGADIIACLDDLAEATAELARLKTTPATTPNGRTTADAISEAERLLRETAGNLDPHKNSSRDGWFLVRLTKIMEALDDRPMPAPPAPPPFDPAKARAWLWPDGGVSLQVSANNNDATVYRDAEPWLGEGSSVNWIKSKAKSEVIELHGFLLGAVRRDYAEHVAKASPAEPAAFDMSKARAWVRSLTGTYYVQVSETKVVCQLDNGWIESSFTVSAIEGTVYGFVTLTGPERDAVLAQYHRDRAKGNA